MSFARLQALIDAKECRVAVGLDPRPDMLRGGETLLDWGKRIIDAVADIVPAVKPQWAFYEAAGSLGIAALSETIRCAKQRGLYVIADAKRGDIGSTADAYADAYLGSGELRADCVTVNPYLGSDGVKPFMYQAEASDGALFALVKTSNPSSAELQDITTESGELVYIRVANMLNALDTTGDRVGFVIGATYPEQLADLRSRFPKTFFLVPGYGAQGGTAEMVSAAFADGGSRAIVSSSRAIICAADVRIAAQKARDEINNALGLR
ncbi:MAG: orotidine-5'-phosphate decarboxylase [Oscillospiraceae bacterium]|jgi:orotidine-5'-phosphate decarboxylase|nr:orotidine-5'-phosphate decarboxylase [Oscillospiraceae bacterium]